MRTRPIALACALALPGLAAAREAPAAESPQLFAPLDLREPPPPPIRREEPPPEEPPFAMGLKADLLVPTSQVDSTGAITVESRYRPAFHDRRLALAIELGWYPLGGEGKSVDPQQGTFSFDWSLSSLPLHVGLEYLPPVPLRLPPVLAALRPYGEGGFAMAFLWSKASYRNADGETFIRDHVQKDTALGWYLGAGALYRLGPGDLLGGYRYDGLTADMDLPFANDGEVGGNHLMAGYRLGF